MYLILVLIKGITDKRAITLNFIVTLLNQFLLMQVVYSGKTEASQPCNFNFLTGFIDVESEEPSDTVNVDVDIVGRRVKEVNGFKREKKLRIAMLRVKLGIV